jgi:hypothetical protein
MNKDYIAPIIALAVGVTITLWANHNAKKMIKELIEIRKLENTE